MGVRFWISSAPTFEPCFELVLGPCKSSHLGSVEPCWNMLPSFCHGIDASVLLLAAGNSLVRWLSEKEGWGQGKCSIFSELALSPGHTLSFLGKDRWMLREGSQGTRSVEWWGCGGGRCGTEPSLWMRVFNSGDSYTCVRCLFQVARLGSVSLMIYNSALRDSRRGWDLAWAWVTSFGRPESVRALRRGVEWGWVWEFLCFS